MDRIPESLSHRTLTDTVDLTRAGCSIVRSTLAHFCCTSNLTDRWRLTGSSTDRGSAVWRSPLDHAELVYNGAAVATGQFSADRLSATLEQTVRIDRSGWLCFRAYAQDRTLVHTSPIYITVAGKPAASAKDAQYFLQWIDRLEAKLNERNRLPSPTLRNRVESQLQAARDVYRKIVSQGG
jgi:hypothetical protein